MGKFIDPGQSKRTVKVVNKHRGKASRAIGIGKHMKNYLKRRKDSLTEAGASFPGSNTAGRKSKTSESDSEFQNLSYKVESGSTGEKSHLQLLKPIRDIFAADEAKANYEQVVRHDLMYIIFDEIALEGLCGITIEALWKRIQYTLKWPVLPWRLKEVIWKVICLSENLCFYQLPEKRPELKINLDFSSKEGDDLFTSRNAFVQDVYKVVLPSKGCTEMGSCSNLTTRKNITDKIQSMSLIEAVKQYENKLVVVARENLRKNALFHFTCDSSVELVPLEYCLLEWIGRLRYDGEITANLLSSSCGFGLDARSMFHHFKILLREHLIVRQSTWFSTSCFDQKTIARLITLRRFYQMKKSKQLILMESIVNYLKNSPQCRAPTSELRSLVGPVYSKLIKFTEYGKYIDSHIVIPYSQYHKSSQFKEYMTKSRTKERTVRLSQLKDPHVNIVAVWDEKLAPDSSDDEDDDEGEVQNDPSKGRRVMNKEFITMVYQFIASKGREGATTSEICQAFDSSLRYMRLVFKKLTSRNFVNVRKLDVGKVVINKYVAKGFSDSDKIVPVTKPGVSSVLEKLREKQRQKVKSLPLNRVYSAENCEQETTNSFSAPKLQLPHITLDWFTSSLTVNLNVPNQELVSEFTLTLKPFHFNFQTCKVVLTDKAPHLEVPELSDRKFRPDQFTKAFLMRAFLDDFKLNGAIDFLDPVKSTRKQKKRPASEPAVEMPNSKIPSIRIPQSFLASMAVEFKLTSKEEIENMAFSLEVYESVPLVQYNTGDISQYKCNDSVLVTERFLARIRFILKTIQEMYVVEDLNCLVKIIVDHEAKSGYDKKIDRKSLHRLLKKVIEEGYVKMFYVVVSRADYKRNQVYVCHPIIDLDHYKLKESIFLLKEKTLAYVQKPSVKPPPKVNEKKSPFIQDDVLSSLHEIQLLLKDTPDAVPLPRPMFRKHFGLRPKFARLALIHEFLFYVVYELKQNTQPLSKTAVHRLFNKHKLSLTSRELDELPPVYANEISWKTFVSPLPPHQNWDEGWALFGDIVLRFPIILIFRCYAVNFTSTKQQELNNHPYKRFYLAKDVSPSIRMMIMHKRRFIADMAKHLSLLCFCGLIQNGPYVFHDKEKLFFYLNRRATLWDTTTSKPGSLIIEEKEYPKKEFYFATSQDVVKYWSTMNSICIGTILNLKNVNKTVVESKPFSKLSLGSASAVRNVENVKKFDTGEIPGDHKGAAGLDSSLFAHSRRNWNFFANKSTPGEMETLLSLKLGKAETSTTLIQTKKPAKYYIQKSNDSKQTVEGVRKKKVTKIKLLPKNTKPVKRLLKKGKKNDFDAVDLAIMRRYKFRYRPNWIDEEDRLLILLKIASVFLTPGIEQQRVSYRVLRDILHTVIPKSRDKASRSISNRLRLLMKTIPFLSKINDLLPNLSKLPVMCQYFFPLRNFIGKEQVIDGCKKSVLSESELTAAFVFLASYFIKNQKEVEIALHGRYTTMDYFNDLNRKVYEHKIEPFNVKKLIYDPPTCEVDVVKNTLKNTIVCALGHRGTNPELSLQTYKIYQQYNQDVLKSTLNELRKHRVIQTHKNNLQQLFFGRYRLSAYYVYSNSTTFWHITMETAYKTFLDMKHRPDECDWSSDVNTKNYGRFFGFNEAMSFMAGDAKLEFDFPKHHLILNPNMEDHDAVVEELARRYQAKLKNKLKSSDSAKNSSTRLDMDEDDLEPPLQTNSHPDQLDEIVISDDVEPLDLSITAQNSSTIDNLKHWISDCIDAERVRSPSPELLNLEIEQEPQDVDDESRKGSSEVDSIDTEVRLLTLEEIKEGMLKPDDETGKREVPYISDLTKLLTAMFDDRDCDERDSSLMKEHFIQKYPTLKDVRIDALKTNYLSEVLERRESIQQVWSKVEREAFVEKPDHIKAISAIPPLENPYFADEILNYVQQKGPLGAPANELKENFSDLVGLQQILNILVENHILLKTGVTQVVFVHYKHQNPWLVNTFHPTTKKDNIVTQTQMELELNVLNTEDIQWYQIKPLPWINLDGTLDRDLFKLWLSHVFSYCIENPKIPFVALCDKFSSLNPVDVFYLLEVLEEIGAVEIRRFPAVTVDLFSDYFESDECKGTVLDSFGELYIEPNNVSFTALGSFFVNCKY